jgi:hypothetical protein
LTAISWLGSLVQVPRASLPPNAVVAQDYWVHRFGDVTNPQFCLDVVARDGSKHGETGGADDGNTMPKGFP